MVKHELSLDLVVGDLSVDHYGPDVSPVLHDPEIAEAKRAERDDLRACFSQSFRVIAAERFRTERVVE